MVGRDNVADSWRLMMETMMGSEQFSPPQPSLQSLVESLLFVADGPVEMRQLARALEVEAEEVAGAVEALAAECRGRGLRLVREGDRVQMVSCPEAAPYVERFLGLETDSKLSHAALETLAIIAYQQPITRSRIQAIRGVNSDRVVATLIARSLVAELGHAPGPGRPALLGTTIEFLHHFGLERLEDMPRAPLAEALP